MTKTNKNTISCCYRGCVFPILSALMAKQLHFGVGGSTTGQNCISQRDPRTLCLSSGIVTRRHREGRSAFRSSRVSFFSKKRFFHLSRRWFQPKARRGLFWLQTLQLNWVVVSRNLERFYAKHMVPAWSMPSLSTYLEAPLPACSGSAPTVKRCPGPHGLFGHTTPRAGSRVADELAVIFIRRSQRPTGTHAFCSSTSASKVLFIFCEQIKSSVRMFTNFNGTSATQIFVAAWDMGISLTQCWP